MPKKYYHFHSDEGHYDAHLKSIQCMFIKPNGLQCQLKCSIGLPFCHHHLPKAYNITIKIQQYQMLVRVFSQYQMMTILYLERIKI